MNESTAKKRWNQIFYNYRKDYLEKYRLERKAERIKGRLKPCDNDNDRKSLRKDLDKTLADLKKYDEHLKKKYKLNRLPDPVELKDNKLQAGSLLPIIEVLSQNGDFLKVKIDRSYPKSVIQRELGEKLKSLDLSEGKKYKKSGRPKLVDPQLVSDRAQYWRGFYKTWQKHSGEMSDEYSKKYISNTTLSALVIERLKEDFPKIKKSTLNEYAKPYLMK